MTGRRGWAIGAAGEDSLDLSKASSLGDESFLEALQMKLQVTQDEDPVRARHDDNDLVRRHRLTSQNPLRPTEGVRIDFAFGHESGFQCGHQSRPSRESWPHNHAATSSRISIVVATSNPIIGHDLPCDSRPSKTTPVTTTPRAAPSIGQ
jgi:hypothetical protein